MHGFVGPIEVHVVLAKSIAVRVEQLRASRFMPDILGLKEIEHSQKVDWIFSRSALVDVRAQRNFRRLETPSHQALIAHLAVARFVVGPAGRVVDPVPWKYVGNGA